MKLRSLIALYLGAVFFIVSCGGEPPTGPSVAQEAIGPGTPVGSKRVFTAPNGTGNSVGFMQQVPIGTARDERVAEATFGGTVALQRNNGGTPVRMEEGTTYGQSCGFFCFGQNDLKIVVGSSNETAPPPSSVPAGDPYDVYCTVFAKGNGAFNGDYFHYLPVLWTTPGHNARYYSFNNTVTGLCRPVAGQDAAGWGLATVSYMITQYTPAAFSWPDSTTTGMQVRIDVDLPQFGVTNRYFYRAN